MFLLLVPVVLMLLELLARERRFWRVWKLLLLEEAVRLSFVLYEYDIGAAVGGGAGGAIATVAVRVAGVTCMSL